MSTGAVVTALNGIAGDGYGIFSGLLSGEIGDILKVVVGILLFVLFVGLFFQALNRAK